MEAKEAVDASVKFIREVYGEATSGLMLEELQQSDDGSKWLITISFNRRKPVTSSIGLLTAGGIEQYERVYKQIQFDAKSGAFLAMTMRQV